LTVFFASERIEMDKMVYFPTDEMVGVRDIQDKEIVSAFDERRILFISIDEITVLRKDIS